MLGNGGGGVAGDVADGDVALAGGGEIDVVEAGGGDQDELEVGELGEGLFGEGDFVGDEDLGSGGVGEDLGGGGGVVKAEAAVALKRGEVEVVAMKGGGVEEGDLHGVSIAVS